MTSGVMTLGWIVAGLRTFATALILCVGVASAATAEERSPIVNFSNDDPDMAAAQAKARTTLAQFWKAHENPQADEKGFALKVAIPVGGNGGAEHIWFGDIERHDGTITGVLGNVPRDVTSLRAGQRIEIAEDRISDWMFMRAGKIVGNQTMRPALKRMQPQEAARYRAMLADP
jgi:uncharacterized protein YegJ (DUF2314 family)